MDIFETPLSLRYQCNDVLYLQCADLPDKEPALCKDFVVAGKTFTNIRASTNAIRQIMGGFEMYAMGAGICEM